MTGELENLATAQADDLAEESATTLKRRSAQPTKRKMPGGGSGNFKRLPFTKETVRASETHNAAQPWELDPSLLPKLPPGRSK